MPRNALKAKLYQAAYRERYKHRIAECKRAWVERNPEREAQRKRAWYLANRDKCIRRSIANKRRRRDWLPSIAWLYGSADAPTAERSKP